MFQAQLQAITLLEKEVKTIRKNKKTQLQIVT
ncbi:hypothetical protein CoNPh2_CDS0154 [Staphylococcus phage S-CoN_Ph2]|nr:hypothetical protein CoNPh2_CDS0154 [Staphylococcus phage S-CoN_Ph2]WNM51868.1 hypothetical protein CoNPh3_CDS0154 [Staphylococcus phage S-CoN_Ph3]WNM51884.1 hypothetical protein CoNPh4_CDS0008 [Staphylococcus phage S-CoN_Ph4]WNM52067.1 hypothetical protein CoNPh5_CDS0021 [Staphylococcus phage S-CoN_Ph5]WNM52547.1 hypothetical protein CoNPh7_CDS0175 [Staphylococcus phage S-CoN_Ph7]WNM52564.1 hypothetical protein CoNPh8_CDS0010 [Staphylococcus phage S-CoN_Ph8]WNM52737.1 hypothetical protein